MLPLQKNLISGPVAIDRFSILEECDRDAAMPFVENLRSEVAGDVHCNKPHRSKQFHRNVCAGLGVGEGVVVVGEVVAAGRGDGLELVVGEPPSIVTPGGGQRIVEFIVRIVHPVHAEHLLETAFVEGAVVGDEGEPLDQRFDLLPDIGKDRGILRVLRSQAMDLPAEPLVVLRLRMDQAVEPVHDLSVANDHDSHAAYAAGALVGRFEIDGCEIPHSP